MASEDNRDWARPLLSSGDITTVAGALSICSIML